MAIYYEKIKYLAFIYSFLGLVQVKQLTVMMTHHPFVNYQSIKVHILKCIVSVQFSPSFT